jgi:hypothetical protein
VSRIRAEVAAYEERLRLAELGLDFAALTELLSDNTVHVEPNGTMSVGREKVLDVHRREKQPPFTIVQRTNMVIVDHGEHAAVVTCKGVYVRDGRTTILKFVRVWVKRGNHWRIVAATVSR